LKTILITGGGGFIGSALVRYLLIVGIRVVVYDNFTYGKRDFLPSGSKLEIVEGDINHTEKLSEVIDQCSPDYLCHLAAIHYIPHCNENPTLALQVNTVGTESVLNAASGKGIKKIIVASSAAVYPITDYPNSEIDTPAAPIDIYGLSKLFTEALAEKYSRETGDAAIVVRLFNAVGPRETNPHVIPHIFESAKKSDFIPLGNIEAKREYIHTKDVAEAIHLLFQSEISGYDIFNVGSGKEYSVVEVVRMIGEVIGRKLTIQQRKDRIRSVDRLHLMADCSKIGKAIGWKPKTSLRTALEDTARYYGFV